MESTYKNTLQDYQNSLLEAINVLSKANDNKNVQTITVEAVIESVDDAAQGIYTVNYMGNVFKAYATGSSYQKEQQVYVLVPNGDFTKKKIIISAVGVNALSQIQEDNSRYIFTSDNIIFDGDIPYSLCSYQNEHYVWNALSEDNKILFYKYSQKQRVFQLSCDIKTKLSPQQIDKRGYYYLTFTYATIMGGVSTPHQITLSVSNILGNPYQLNDWSNQKIIFKLDENEEVDKDFMPTLTLGCNNFIQNNSKTEKDIFFKNFTLQSLEDASLVKGYKLYLTADKGTYMRPPQVTAIKLAPELRYNGTIIDLTDAECFWFEQDAAITVEDEKFLSYGGPGWACLNQRKSEEDENGETFTYFVTDKYFSRTIMDNDIILNKFYKCIIIKENTTYSAEIEISQLNSDYALTVVADNKVYEKNAGNVVITASTNITPVYSEVLTFDWVRQDKNKKYISNDFYEIKKAVKNQQEVIAFPTRLVNEINYVVCSLRSSVRGLLASKTIEISVSEQLGYKLVIENGDVSYKYDASGKSQYLGAGYVSGSATAQPIAPLNLKIYKEDGKELNNDEYLSCDIKWRMPKEKTLLVKVDEPIEETDEYYVFSGMSLNYDIASYYNKSSVNNKIFLDIVFGDKTLSAVAQPHFVMDGAMGTNGTKINTVIRYKGYSCDEEDAQGNKHICKLIYTYKQGNWEVYDEEGNQITSENSYLPFVLDVYIEGKKVSENGVWIEGHPPMETAATCSWSVCRSNYLSIPNPNYSFPGLGEIYVDSDLAGIFYPQVGDPYENNSPYTIIKADITYAGKTVTTYYPIDVIIDGIGEAKLEELLQFNIKGGFNCVLYNNTGNYPIYDKTPFLFNGPDIYKGQIFEAWTRSPHLHTNYSSNETEHLNIVYNQEFNIKVAESFNSQVSNWYDFDDSVVCVGIEKNNNWLEYHKPVIVMCNTYSLALMNDWDGQKVQINDNESIYAPILGAGKKESNNTFSGFLMGDIKEANVTDTSPRFTAYHKGVRTFNIDANTGKVTIGAGNGQIIIDPDANGNPDKCKAVIKSGNYKTGTNGEGMEIDFTDPHIYFGSGKFKVDSEGKVTMTEADVQGKITSEEGKIANFNIIKNYLYTGSSNADTNSGAVCLASDDFTRTIHNISRDHLRLAIGGKFAVAKDGTLYAGDIVATGGSFKGDITGARGTFSGNLSGSTITGATIKNSSGTFSVDANGNIKGANITGSTFTGANNKFKVDTNGTVTCSDMHITDGTIKLGGLELTSSGLTSTKTTQFGPFKCDINSIFANALDSEHGWGGTNTPTVFMCTGSTGAGEADEGQTIAGVTKKGWCFGAGHRFGVDIDGNVYCSAIKISGESTSSATSTIGNMSVFPGYLLISLGRASDGNTYTMSLGPHNFNSADYLFSITSTDSSGPQVHMAITASGNKIGF